jgi:hypothetical protein
MPPSEPIAPSTFTGHAENRELLLPHQILAGPTRYDKLARNFLAATALVGALYGIKLGVLTLMSASLGLSGHGPGAPIPG